jgi:hypothetical protein
MGHDVHSSHPPEVPPELLADRKRNWAGFKLFTIAHCIGIAVLLLLMLVFLRLM